MVAAVHSAQGTLFGIDEQLPAGFTYLPAIVDAAAEAALLEVAGALPLHEARFWQYTARRRVFAFGSRFDYDQRALQAKPIGELPAPLEALRERLAEWVCLPPGDFVHVMIAQYLPGTPLGWHRDAPPYEVVVGVSLGGPARLRFRPWPAQRPKKQDIKAIDLAPRSAYCLRGEARWAWQHSVPPVPALRYSVTMRTARG
jgi:alkylated DNA repair dioxygenase AlkB